MTNAYQLPSEMIARVDPAITVPLAAATLSLLEWQAFPASMCLMTENPRVAAAGTRRFEVINTGLCGVYHVSAKLVGSTMLGGRPVTNMATFLIRPEDTYLEPDAILALGRSFASRREPHFSLLAPQSILRDLGKTVSDLSRGQGVFVDEYWEMLDKP